MCNGAQQNILGLGRVNQWVK